MSRETIKEATSLVAFYSGILPWYNPKDNMSKAKQCAIKVVDLLIKELDEHCDTLHSSDRKQYWQEVEKEIEYL